MADDDWNDDRLPLVQEELHVSKRWVSGDKVRVRTVVDAIPEIARETLHAQQVYVTRVPIDKLVEAAPVVRTEGSVTIVPIIEEILVVEKKLLLKEEIHIRRVDSNETVEVPVTLRKQRAIIERLEGETDRRSHGEIK